MCGVLIGGHKAEATLLDLMDSLCKKKQATVKVSQIVTTYLRVRARNVLSVRLSAV